MTITFVIDTTSYAGNFEREMASFITGHQMGLDSKYSQDFLNIYEKPLKNIVKKNTDFGLSSVSLIPTPGYFNNGYGFHAKEGEEELAKDRLKLSLVYSINLEKQRILKELELNPEREILKLRLTQLEKEIDNIEQEVESMEKYPAYMSVGIFFSEIDEDTRQLLVHRANKFAKQNGIEIVGFRKIQE